MKIVVIEAAGLHLGYLGCYGNDWVATPNLDRLAVEGIVFDWHFVDRPELTFATAWPERSVGTGRFAFPGQPMEPVELPTRPRVIRCESLANFGTELAAALPSADPWLWIEGPSLLPPWHLEAELLDVYFDEDDIEEGLTPWIDPPLGLRMLNEAEVLQLQNTYAAAVTLFDAQLGALLDLPDTLLCVTARSGLPLGEHDMLGAPLPRLHDELVHVPLLMRLPRCEQAGLRIAALTQPLDLLPTYLEALGQPAPPMDGRCLWPLIRGDVDEIRPHAISALRGGGEESWLMRTPEWAFHLPMGDTLRSPQLFVKPDDRWEVNDLYSRQIEVADELSARLRELTVKRRIAAR